MTAAVLSMAVVFTAIPVNFAYGEEAAAPGITVYRAYPGDSVTVSVRATDFNAIGGLTDVDLKAMTAFACTDSITVNQKQEEVVKPQMQIRWDGKITDKRNITVDVSLPEDCPVSVGDFIISYNKEQIVCTSAETDGELSGKGGIIVTKEETGNGAVRFLYVNPDPSNEAVVLLHLTFAVQGKFTGVTKLTPSGKDVVDKSYKDIELDYAPVELDIPKIDISGSTVTGIEKEYVYTGKAITPEVTVDGLTEGQDYEVAYSDNVNVGTAKVTITGKGSCTGKIEKTFSITPADISKKEVTGLKESYVYTGKAITPEVTIEGLTEKKSRTSRYRTAAM